MKKLCLVLITVLYMSGCANAKPTPTHALTCFLNEKEDTSTKDSSVEYLYNKDKTISATIKEVTTPAQDMDMRDQRQLMDQIRTKESLFNTLQGVESVFALNEGILTLEYSIDFIEASALELVDNALIPESVIKDEVVDSEGVKTFYETKGAGCTIAELEKKK